MTSSVSSTGGTGTTIGPVVSVAGSSSADAAGGSVINVSSLVSQLVAAAQGPQETLITNQTEAVTAKISAVGTLQSALSTFQSSLSPLDTPGAFNALTASSSDSSVLTVTADSDATAGTYTVVVSALAQAQQLRSSVVSGGATAAVGTGTLGLSLGGTSFNVAIDSSDDTLDGIASAINAASGNPGITAAVLEGSDGAYLVLSSTLTGAANTIQVTETDGGDGLAVLTYGAGNTANYTQQTAAQDASYTIAGVSGTSASNTLTGALSGVTLDLLGTTGSGGVTLTVSNDTSTIQGNIASFVSAYNTLLGTYSSLGGYDASTQTAGTLMGNPLLTNIQNQTNEALYSIVNTGSPLYNTLASIGITTNSDGTLSVNSTTLSNALSTNLSAVSQLFGGSSGVAAALNSQISNDLSSGGSIGAASQSLTSQENSLTQQSNTLSTQMAALSASLTQQYSALNTLLSSLQTTSAYLSQAFDDLPKVQGSQSA
ncbi:MAG TPA: flagellar filament capping protein FliD [Steroidobacteraceae bacterium]|jgi:flagellar hook-associated protein 2|nr:flagellar filament capping protein FliD [Steroidobacteraceae bacterium]